MLILILLPSGICCYSNFGFTSVLFAERPASSSRTSRTQTAPIQKPLYICARAEPKPTDLARGWVSWLMFCAPAICPPCVWIRARPRPHISAHCENTFLSVDKRHSEMMSSLFKDCGLWVLTVFPVKVCLWSLRCIRSQQGFILLSYLGVSKNIYARLCHYLLIVRLNILWFSSVDWKFGSEVGERFSFALHILL